MTAERFAIETGVGYLAIGPRKTHTGLICIHGWGCQASDFRMLFEQLSQRNLSFRAVAVDLPGHGETPKEACKPATISGFASATLTLIDKLGMSSVVLLGHSMGSRVVLDAWSQAEGDDGALVKGIVFLDGSHYKLRPSLFAFDSNDSRSKGMFDDDKAAKKKEMFMHMFSSRTPRDFQTSALAHIKGLDKDYANEIRESHIDYDYTKMDDALACFGDSGLPLLNLQSTDVDAENQRFPLKAGEESKWTAFIQEKVPHAKQYVIEDSAHFPHVDRPALVAEKLLEFVNYVFYA